MRKVLKIVWVFILAGCTVPAFAGNPVAFLNFASFATPGGDNYLETYVKVVGNSMNFIKGSNNKYSAKAHIILTLKSGDSVVAGANFNVLSPEMGDTLAKPNFIDAHRFWLKKGDYTLSFTMDDPNDNGHKTITGSQIVHVGYEAHTVSVSDVEYLESFTASNAQSPYNKCGYQMIPYVFLNYPEKIKKMSFYCEIYNTIKSIEQTKKVVVQYSIESSGDYELNGIKAHLNTVRMDPDTVLPLLAQVPIDDLPTGSFKLVVSVMDENNHILAKRKFEFNRDNPGVKSVKIPAGFAVYMQNKDTLIQSIKCLAPISGRTEQGYVEGDSLQGVSMPELKRFFYYFWLARDSANPLEAWQKYLDEVMAVNNSFSMPHIKGYKTDRGRVYLQYGKPGQRTVEVNNPSTYPYEIWQYYRTPDGQTNVEFVFYSTAPEINNYVILHSTAIGEIQNPQWQTALYSRLDNHTLLPNNIDQQTVPDQLGEDVNSQFNNPH